MQLFPGTNEVSAIYKAVAGNAMSFFLLANLLTGGVNLAMQPALMTNLSGRIILTSYVFALCVVFRLKQSVKS